MDRLNRVFAKLLPTMQIHVITKYMNTQGSSGIKDNIFTHKITLSCTFYLFPHVYFPCTSLI